MHTLLRTSLVIGLLTGWSVPTSAAEWNPEELEKIVRQSTEIYIKAFQERNAARIAQLFTESAEYVDGSGLVFHGREVIQAELAAAFAARPKGELTVELLSIRPLADNVLVEEGQSEFRPEQDGAVSVTRYTATHVKGADGAWRIASIRELENTLPTPHERLKELAWLVGRWRDESVDTVVNSEWKWSGDGNFLIGEFAVNRVGETSRQGTHRIGWDPQRKQFRSWIFDASGGFAEGYWTGGDGVWSVKLSACLADSTCATGVLRYERDGVDSLIVSQLDRECAGEMLPNVSTRVVRTPPDPQ